MEFKSARPAKPKASGTSYWIVPPGESKKVRYRRMSRFISIIEDSSNLVNRDLRYAGYGIATDERLASQIRDLEIENPDHKYNIQQVVERAARRAGKWLKADYGTALHAVTEDFDAGYNVFTDTPPSTPSVSELAWGPKEALTEYWSSIRADARAYAALIDAYDITYTSIEATVVLDKYQVAGTLDRLGSIGKPRNMPMIEGSAIGDVKTGNLDFGRLKMPMQFKGYADSVLYDHEQKTRTPHGANPDWAFVIHVPMGEGRAMLVPLQLEQAAKNLERCHEIWAARKEDDINDWIPFGIDDWLTERIPSMKSEAELSALYHATRGMWNDSHVELARQKAKEF